MVSDTRVGNCALNLQLLSALVIMQLLSALVIMFVLFSNSCKD